MSTIRRSSRANKGKHQKLAEEQKEYEELLAQQLRDAEEERNRSDSDNAGNNDEVLCLVCGTTDDNYDPENDDRDMIQCEQCETWQHNICVLEDPKKIPKVYQCSLCDASNEYFKTLKFTIDPQVILNKRVSSSKDKKKPNVKRKKNDGDNDQEFLNNGASENKDDARFSDNGEEDDLDLSYSDEDKQNKISRLERSKRSGRSTGSSNPTESAPKPKRSKLPQLPPTRNIDKIEEKARLAVTERFHKMFTSLLTGTTIPSEEGTNEEISQRWAKKLEAELFNCYHDRETGKLTKDYKESSARIFSNLKDVKNTKLRTSIINKSIPFAKLVKMPVNELLNPDLRKEKEEAIKESMTLATLERAEVSKIRRTHKGDIVLENENEDTNGQAYDLNVGISIDNDEKKFIKSETNVNNERKNSLYANNNSNFDDGDDGEPNDSFQDNSFDNDNEREKTPTILEEKDEDFEELLGSHTKVLKPKLQEEAEEKDKKPIWEGLVVFSEITSLDAQLEVVASTLTNNELERLVPHMLEYRVPFQINGRLDQEKADKYVKSCTERKKLVLLELKAKDNRRKFEKIYEYFNSRNKYGVVTAKDKPYIKDAYILPYHDKSPRFITGFHKKEIPGPKEPRLFVIYVINQELIKGLEPKAGFNELEETNNNTTNSDEYDPTNPLLNNSDHTSSTTSNTLPVDFQSLNPNEQQLIQKVLQKHPEALKDTNLLFGYLQEAINNPNF